VAGPVGTSFGPVCLGLSGGLATTPVTLDGAGSYVTGGVLPLAGIGPAGATTFVQAALAGPSFPFGIGLTNGWAVSLRPPASRTPASSEMGPVPPGAPSFRAAATP
jgi:hypothetical protein